MAALIPVAGVGPDYRTPGTYPEVVFAQGASSASAGVRQVVFCMPMLSTGTWTAATLYGPIANEKEVSDGAGLGSPMHRSVRKFLRSNKDAKVYCLPCAETSGGSPLAATATAVFANTSTGIGVATVTICGEECAFSFPSGRTVTQLGDDLVAVINAKTWLPVTASNASGTVTITAKLKGTSQGTATVAVVRTRGAITSGVTTTLTVSTHVGAVQAGVEGSTTEAATFLTALGTIDARRFYYIVSSGNTSTYLTNLVTHLTTKAEPKRNMRSVGITAYVGTLAAATTLAIARNHERLTIGVLPNADHDCAEVAGWLAAVRQKEEQTDSSFCFDGYSNGELLPAYNPADWPSGDSISDAINDGLTVIASNESRAYIAMSCNTRSKNSAGLLDDFRATETHRVSVADEFVDELVDGVARSFVGKKLRDDEHLADGSINPVQKLLRTVVTPSRVVATIKKQMNDYFDGEKLSDVEASKLSVRAVKSPVNSGRVECGFDLRAIDHAHQFTVRVAEVSPG
jgi:phage tail sheath gpL-like